MDVYPEGKQFADSCKIRNHSRSVRYDTDTNSSFNMLSIAFDERALRSWRKHEMIANNRMNVTELRLQD